MQNNSGHVARHIKCQSCSISELYLPFTLNDKELNTLDSNIDRKRSIHKGDKTYTDGQKLHCLFAVRSSTFKTFTVGEQGEEQITGFHLAGDLLGFDAIADSEHKSFVQALETSMVCEIPYNSLDELSNTMPKLKKQVLRLMTNEIRTDQEMLTLLNRKDAEQRVATFLVNLND
jgi:CRP/FNR family transcriptional regulator